MKTLIRKPPTNVEVNALDQSSSTKMQIRILFYGVAELSQNYHYQRNRCWTQSKCVPRCLKTKKHMHENTWLKTAVAEWEWERKKYGTREHNRERWSHRNMHKSWHNKLKSNETTGQGYYKKLTFTTQVLAVFENLRKANLFTILTLVFCTSYSHICMNKREKSEVKTPNPPWLSLTLLFSI